MGDSWEAYQFLTGEWEGGNTGDPGQGQGKFEIAPPGQEQFSVYVEGTVRRVR